MSAFMWPIVVLGMVANMAMIDAIYEAGGLKARGN